MGRDGSPLEFGGYSPSIPFLYTCTLKGPFTDGALKGRMEVLLWWFWVMSLPLNPTTLSSCKECTDLNESQKFKRKDQKGGFGCR